MKKLFLLSSVLIAAAANAALHTESIKYKQGKTECIGYLAYDDAVQTKRPGVLVTQEWWGLNDHMKQMTENVAKMGYVAFAPDVYGAGQVTTDPSEAGKLSGIYKSERGLMRNRMIAALDVLKKQQYVDTGHLAAIGFCFGGTCALELARSGADLDGTVAFHAGLDTPTPEDAKNIKGKVLVLNGGDDGYISKDQIAAFEDEMRKANVDWQLFNYGGAVHGFTNSTAGSDNSKGYAYNPTATRRAMVAMQDFFKEIFTK
jgi:dienelactone hydrolase